MTEYVASNPWRSFGPAAPDSDPGLMAKAREGGEAVAAAAAAAATAGIDANEIDLGEFSDDEGREEAKGKVGGSTAAGRPGPDRSRRVGRVRRRGRRRRAVERRGGAKREAPEAAGTNAVDSCSKTGEETQAGVHGIRRLALHPPVGVEARGQDGRGTLRPRPYEHDWLGTKMSFAQRRFDDGGASGGFASTVWDSSIVLAKYVEKHRGSFANKRACELGAGCGVVSAALVKAGCARVVATDLPENLPLLRENMERNCGEGERTARARGGR